MEDARYDQEWAYKLAGDSASSSSNSSGSSSSAKTSASSSSASDTATTELSLLSNVADYVVQGASRREDDIKGYIAEAEAYGTLAELPNYYPQLEMLLSMAGNSGATEAELKTIIQKWHKS